MLPPSISCSFNFFEDIRKLQNNHVLIKDVESVHKFYPAAIQTSFRHFLTTETTLYSHFGDNNLVIFHLPSREVRIKCEKGYKYFVQNFLKFLFSFKFMKRHGAFKTDPGIERLREF